MLFQFCATVCDTGPALNNYWIYVFKLINVDPRVQVGQISIYSVSPDVYIIEPSSIHSDIQNPE